MALLDAVLPQVEAGERTGGLFARFDHDRLQTDEIVSHRNQRPINGGVERVVNAVGTPTAVFRLVVELRSQKRHQTFTGSDIPGHCLLLKPTVCVHCLDPLAGIRPLGGRTKPLAALAVHRHLDLKKLERCIHATRLHVHLLRQRTSCGAIRLCKRLKDCCCDLLRRKRRLDEVILDTHVLCT